MKRTALGLTMLVWLAGCASTPDATEESATQSSHLEANAEQAFETALNGAFEDYNNCVSQSDCAAGATSPLGDGNDDVAANANDNADSGDTGTDSDDGLGDDDGITTKDLGIGSQICNVLAPLARLEHPYFFVGGSVSGGAGVTGQGGVDLVWDFWNRQAAAFSYGGGGLTSLVGVDAAVYSGYGFGNKTSVIDAWSGRFNTVSVSVGLPVLNLAAGGSGFASPDGSIMGGAVSASIGFDWVPTPVNGGFITAVWTPFNAATQAWNSRQFFTGGAMSSTGGHSFIQFSSARGLATSILQTSPNALGAQAAAEAVAMDVLKSQGISISQLCGIH